MLDEVVAQNQLLLPNITDKSSSLPNQKSYWIESNLSPPKIHQNHPAYSRDRSIQTFLTRFPLTHSRWLLVSFPFIFHISNSYLIFTSSTHVGSINILYSSLSTTTISIDQLSSFLSIGSKWTFK